MNNNVQTAGQFASRTFTALCAGECEMTWITHTMIHDGDMSVGTSAVSDQFDVAKRWAALADSAIHDSALEAYQIAIELLYRLGMLGLDVQSWRRWISLQSCGFCSSC